ncbi:dGTP triphosphohydrolase [[Synechococcus] sp. NIES-970]|nr:dGTP triphosphohydrolase [[Synechococcus] sp. NIES-970]
MCNSTKMTERRSKEDNQLGLFNASESNTDYQRDRARVIHSSAFRRLQSKTQVLGLGESDFYRTRLTHSLEAAQIGSGICETLKEKYNDKEKYIKYIPSLHLIESICLSHDIGHPPFGHGGEVALNYCMSKHGGFEGNGQTLRIISKLGEYSPEHGFDLTRRAMLGILKYPAIYEEVVKSNQSDSDSLDPISLNDWKPPKCIFKDEIEVLDWILEAFCDQDKEQFKKTETADGSSHKRSVYNAFDTSIMELADDIAYGIHDLEDALALDLISLEQWNQEIIEELKHDGLDDCILIKNQKFYEQKLFSKSNKDRKHAISKFVSHFISNVEIQERNQFEHKLLDYKAILPDPEAKKLKLIKKFVVKHVIKRTEVQTLEYRGQQMLVKLFKALQANPKRLLPKNTLEKYESAEDRKERTLSDYVSGMTDSYATKLYNRLFNPNMGSIFDRL